ncbi:MAG: 6-phosphogluconolactonase, partial [Verrucomicrobia bacterium]|nr:6-phosphogluconolactonase [Verrucomicrobiota bacterium]
IEPNAIHRLRGELPPPAAAEAASTDLLASVERRKNGLPVLDLILLGLGEDGHIASLFPGEAEALAANPALFRPVVASKPPPLRLTMGYPLIAAADAVWVLASGKGKEVAFAESLRDDGRTPCARLLRMRSVTTIFTDITLPVL